MFKSKQIFPCHSLVDSYTSIKEQRSKISKLILKKYVRNITIPHEAKSIKSVSQVCNAMSKHE